MRFYNGNFDFIIFGIIIVFHFEISGKDDNDEHLQNNQFIFLTLLVFHLEISGKDNNDEHLENISLI